MGSKTPSHDPRRVFRILTYNVHSCRGTDGKVDPARIAEVIDQCKPDIVALQEVDVGRARTGGVDQAKLIGSHLRMKSHFHPALHLEDEKYGDAILTALPSRLVRAGPLPSLGEARGAIWMSVDVGDVELQVINTHLGLWRRERMQQVATLLGPGWLGSPACKAVPSILLGDFNAVPASAAYRTIARKARDVQRHGRTPPKATFPSRFPLLRLDHIFVGEGIIPIDFEVCTNLLARTASDHLPLLATIAFESDEPGTQDTKTQKTQKTSDHPGLERTAQQHSCMSL